MPDEIIEELWAIKDDIAREHGNDIRKLAACLKGRKHSSETPVRPDVDALDARARQRPFKTSEDAESSPNPLTSPHRCPTLNPITEHKFPNRPSTGAYHPMTHKPNYMKTGIPLSENW